MFLLDRSGQAAGYLRAGPDIVIPEPATQGRIPDLMRRCLGLPTAPPQDTTDGLLTRLWLNNIVGAGEQTGLIGAVEWDTVVRLHPALQLAIHAGLTIGPDQVLPTLRLAAEVWTWSRLACQAAQPGWLRDLLPAVADGWMDEGILSRWLLDTLPSIETLLKQVTPVTTAATAARLRVVLDQLGVTAGP